MQKDVLVLGGGGGGGGAMFKKQFSVFLYVQYKK